MRDLGDGLRETAAWIELQLAAKGMSPPTPARRKTRASRRARQPDGGAGGGQRSIELALHELISFEAPKPAGGPPPDPPQRVRRLRASEGEDGSPIPGAVPSA